MIPFIGWHYWRAEGRRFRSQPVAWISLGALFIVLLMASISAGLSARDWRVASQGDAASRTDRLTKTVEQIRRSGDSGLAAAIATYQAGRSDLGATRMRVKDGLGLGVQRLQVLPVELRASLDNRLVDARNPGALKNPLLISSGLPGVPATVALLLPLVALILCAGLLQEEREQGRLTLLRVQANQGIGRLVGAALGWRFLSLWLVALASTLPALALDPSASFSAALQWCGYLGLFCLSWVVLWGSLSWLTISSAASMLVALGIWLAFTFVVPAALVSAAQARMPMPSRLSSIVQIRAAQQESEEHDQELAKAWYANRPAIPAQLPAIWPASFVVRAIEQEHELRPMVKAFEKARVQQSDFVGRWAWLSPGLALVLAGEHLAGTDAYSHLAYLRQVDLFEQRWRDFLVPYVMNGKGLPAHGWAMIPDF